MYIICVLAAHPTNSTFPLAYPNMARMNMVVLGALALLPFAFALPSGQDVNAKQQNARQVDRAQAVVDTFRISWDGYYTYAFPNDELKPATNLGTNSRCVIHSLI